MRWVKNLRRLRTGGMSLLLLLMGHPNMSKSPWDIFRIKSVTFVLGNTMGEAAVASSDIYSFDSFNT